jgi:hypothetical protein
MSESDTKLTSWHIRSAVALQRLQKKPGHRKSAGLFLLELNALSQSR